MSQEKRSADPVTPAEFAGSTARRAGETAGEPSLPAEAEKIAFAAPLAPGDLGAIGRYRVIRETGRGAMGAVFLAIDTRLERRVALKVMLPCAAASAVARERFLREARLAASVMHENVVTIYEASEEDGVPCIAMQFLEGYTLEFSLMKRGRPTIAQSLRILREAACGLDAAHRIGLIHRDVKPSNLWLEVPGDRLKVLDFGLARPIERHPGSQPDEFVVGTPAYMSPEQAEGGPVDGRTDVFSLGATAYRMCGGRFAFGGSTAADRLKELRSGQPTPLAFLNPEVPPRLAELIHEMLEKDPENRVQTVAEVAERARHISAAHVRSRRTRTYVEVSDVDEADPDDEVLIALKSTPSLHFVAAPRRRVPTWLGVVAAILAVALCLVILIGRLGRNAAANQPAGDDSTPAAAHP
jgi:serine/threonine protein kinase